MLGLKEIYGAEYLRAMMHDTVRVVIPDPENAFNRDQKFAAKSTFGALLSRAATMHARHTSGAGLSGGVDAAVASDISSRVDNVFAESMELRSNVERLIGHAKTFTALSRGRAVLLELLSDATIPMLRSEQPGLLPRAVTQLWPAWLRLQRFDMQSTLGLLSAGARFVDVIVLNRTTGEPVEGAFVQLVYSRASRLGVEVYTDAFGKARVVVPAAFSAAELLVVHPRHSLWPTAIANPDIAGGALDVTVAPIHDFLDDALTTLALRGSLSDGEGVRVGVIDSGVGPHPELKVVGGANLVVTDDPSERADYSDNGFGHGTHVAGIIAARGLHDARFRGVAPGVELYSYRTMARGWRSAEDVAVADAIETAIEDGCHILNISLGGEVAVREVSDAIARAFANGILVVAAAGNDHRQPVNFPAANAAVIAVSALGLRAGYPTGAVSALSEVPPFIDKPPIASAFVAAFSNVGAEIDVIGPGVGIISTYPGGKLSVSDGTSMSAPVVVGVLARLLSQNKHIRDMPPTQERAEKMTQLLLNAARALGFDVTHEGKGLVLP